MRFDEEVMLSPAGRQAIEERLRLLLIDRENCRAEHARAVRQAYRSMEAIVQHQKMCDDFCADLGFVSEGEAIKELLGAKQTGRVKAWSGDADQQACVETPDEEERR